MPELVPTWEALVELAGGGDVESRFLSMWCPPPYIGGCSQALWFDARGHEEPALLRNYDFAPLLLEGSWLATRWTGQRVAALGDCLWGALDGVNEAGLAAALSFGGRNVSGTGFGIPLLLRHVLEVAQNTAEAIQLLQRVPASMCYSITLLDRHDDWATVFVSPDRPTEVSRQRVVTNFQHEVEWPQHAQATHAVQRRDKLQSIIDTPHTLHQASAGAAARAAVPARLPARPRHALQRGLSAAQRTHRAGLAAPAMAPIAGRFPAGSARYRLSDARALTRRAFADRGAPKLQSRLAWPASAAGGRNCARSSSKRARFKPRREQALWKRWRSNCAHTPCPVMRVPKLASLSRPPRISRTRAMMRCARSG